MLNLVCMFEPANTKADSLSLEISLRVLTIGCGVPVTVSRRTHMLKVKLLNLALTPNVGVTARPNIGSSPVTLSVRIPTLS